ncbi:MAG TPA: YebC/PmpR family DNA-binding transcriptional regulator [Patescibacteria group bacterium]|nr:YebC/PmpR family DNA-binding transcriptional regulator [Patescibacteria group bacterium]
MSGHSKWSTIKRQKGAADAKRGQAFTKLSNAITVAVKAGGGITDLNSNFKLRLAVDRARAVNMPKENIERAIERAKGMDAADVQEFLYEGFGPGGVALMIEAVTDNKQRSFSTIKNIVEKNGGTLGSSGSVSYLFVRRGEIVVKKNGESADDILNKAIEAGVSDMEEADEEVIFYVEPQSLEATRQELVRLGFQIESAELTYSASTFVAGDEDVQSRVASLVEKLEEIDDVQQVYSNLE